MDNARAWVALRHRARRVLTLRTSHRDGVVSSGAEEHFPALVTRAGARTGALGHLWGPASISQAHERSSEVKRYGKSAEQRYDAVRVGCRPPLTRSVRTDRGDEEQAVTTIKASCPVCGDVELTPPDLRLVVCTYAQWSYYAFDCPTCHDEVRKSADDEIIALLVSGSVRPVLWRVPAEALESKSGAPINYDELLDFVLWLDGADSPIAALEATQIR